MWRGGEGYEACYELPLAKAKRRWIEAVAKQIEENVLRAERL